MFDIPSSSSSFDTYGVDKWNDVCARKRRGTSLAASVFSSLFVTLPILTAQQWGGERYFLD